jgi:predicted GTPase
VGHDLKLCTQEVEKFRHSLPGLAYGDLVFVDTPGFDEVSTSDIEVLKMVDNWLKSAYVFVSLIIFDTA